ncbi:MAG: hypothetical protein IID31_08265 [Planctomycetes bacterium]|nr:hypothetical protein [Planctomycetota bacterium]
MPDTTQPSRTHCTRAIAVLGAVLMLSPAGMGLQEQAETGLPDLAAIMASVSQIRELEFLRDVPAEKQAQAEWGAYLHEEISAAYPPDEVDGLVRGLVKLGLLSETIDLVGELETALLTQAGAYYDTKSGTFYYLMLDMPADQLGILASHELAHALQDQHFDLERVQGVFENTQGDEPRNDDAMLAVSMLIEGEATYLMTLWQAASMGGDLTRNRRVEEMTFRGMADLSMSMLTMMTKAAGDMFPPDSDIGKAMAAMEDIPPYIMEPMLAAYMKGAYFTMRLRRHGGWDAVSTAYSDLPRSSEQVLHPEKYFGGEDGAERDEPTMIRLPEFPSLTELGFEPIDAAIHGEFYLGVLLRNLGVNEYVVAQAIEGWDGDVYRAYARPSGETMIVLATTWDTDKDAGEFLAAYSEALSSKYGEDAPSVTHKENVTHVIVESDRGFEGHAIRRGREVFVVEGASRELTKAILSQLIWMELERID